MPKEPVAPGAWVALENDQGESLGYGFFNPHSLIAYRTFERTPFESEEKARYAFDRRMDVALRLREQAYPGTRSFRLCFGESDGFPGLIVDLYESAKGGVAVVQCHSAGADHLLTWLQDWLAARLKITAGIIRNDIDVRNREKVELYQRTWGDLPLDIYASENGLRFFVDVKSGQKTGFFYDHRDNRTHFAQMLSRWDGKTPDVLDCFSYVGAWGLAAAKANPRARVTCVDISKPALDLVLRNAAENGLKDRVDVIEADFFKQKDRYSGKRYDVVACDPPAMSNSAKDIEASKRAHERCFQIALEVMKPEGLAVFAACSFHLTWEDFLEVSRRAASHGRQQLILTWLGSQAADHPILGSLPETRYLKCAFGHLGERY